MYSLRHFCCLGKKPGLNILEKTQLFLQYIDQNTTNANYFLVKCLSRMYNNMDRR